MRRALTELGLAFVMLVLAPASVRAADPLDPGTAGAIRDYVIGELAALGVPGAAVGWGVLRTWLTLRRPPVADPTGPRLPEAATARR